MIGTGTVGSDETHSITPNRTLKAGETLTATASDSLGNTSGVTSFTVSGTSISTSESITSTNDSLLKTGETQTNFYGFLGGLILLGLAVEYLNRKRRMTK